MAIDKFQMVLGFVYKTSIIHPDYKSTDLDYKHQFNYH